MQISEILALCELSSLELCYELAALVFPDPQPRLLDCRGLQALPRCPPRATARESP